MNRELLLFLLIAIVPAYFINKWLKILIRPKESLWRLLAFITCIVALALCISFAVVWFMLRDIPRPPR